MEINGSTCVVCGGANGLGEAAVRALVARGAKVGILDLAESAGPTLQKELGDDVAFAATDVRDADSVQSAVDALVDELGPLSACINTAGIATAARMVGRDGERFPVDLFRRTIEVNLIGTFNVMRAAVGSMAAKGVPAGEEAGVLVNVASIAAFDGQRGQAAYSASKAGVAGMTLPLARDLAGVGVRVMTIAPGIMGTRMLYDGSEQLQAKLVREHQFPKREGRPEEFAQLVCSILENPLLNGEVIRLDAAARLGPG